MEFPFDRHKMRKPLTGNSIFSDDFNARRRSKLREEIGRRRELADRDEMASGRNWRGFPDEMGQVRVPEMMPDHFGRSRISDGERRIGIPALLDERGPSRIPDGIGRINMNPKMPGEFSRRRTSPDEMSRISALTEEFGQSRMTVFPDELGLNSRIPEKVPDEIDRRATTGKQPEVYSSNSTTEECSTLKLAMAGSDEKPRGYISMVKRNSVSTTQKAQNEDKNEEEEDGEGEEEEKKDKDNEIKQYKEPEREQGAEKKKVKKKEEPKKEETDETVTAVSAPPMDIVLLLDGSSSITESVFRAQVLQFSAQFAQAIRVSRAGNHLALVQFSGQPRTEFGLAEYFNQKRLDDAIRNIRYMNGGTMLGQALDYTHKKVLNDRGNTQRQRKQVANKFIVVVTDGASEDDVATPAKALRDDNVHIIVVGVGPDVNQQQLDMIAGSNAGGCVYSVQDFAQLNDALVGRLRTKICDKLEEKEEEEDEVEDQKEVMEEPKPPAEDKKDQQKPKKTKKSEKKEGGEMQTKNVHTEESYFHEF